MIRYPHARNADAVYAYGSNDALQCAGGVAISFDCGPDLLVAVALAVIAATPRTPTIKATHLDFMTFLQTSAAVWAQCGEWQLNRTRQNARVRELVAAIRRGRRRGQELRQQRQAVESQSHFNVGWLLRHPTDHYLRLATRTAADPECRAVIENQIAGGALLARALLA